MKISEEIIKAFNNNLDHFEKGHSHKDLYVETFVFRGDFRKWFASALSEYGEAVRKQTIEEILPLVDRYHGLHTSVLKAEILSLKSGEK